ncbi:hypothetical protein ACFP9V_22770 [Deinococcus radiopugnans]
MNASVAAMSLQEINTSLKWFERTIPSAQVLTQVEAYERLKKVTP